VHPDAIERARPEFEGSLATIAVAGGDSRPASVWNAVMACDPRADLVAIHDAVRPFASAVLCKLLCETAAKRGAAVPILPINDTVKRTEGEVVAETIRRFDLKRVQTPQVFQLALFIEACEYVRSTGGFSEAITDDASIVEAFGREVAVVLGEEYNFKITTSRDLRMAEALLAAGLVDS